jgi:hypothetical protein
MPDRVQLRRLRGWRMPPNTVKVDRSTRWGNPFRIGLGYTVADTVGDFERWICGQPLPYAATQVGAPPSLEQVRRHLMGRNLACWCRIGEPCHAEVLLRLANEVASDSKAGL